MIPSLLKLKESLIQHFGDKEMTYKRRKIMDNNYSIDLSSLSKELRLLLEILKTEEYESLGLDKKELYKDINWGRFLKLAWHHRVYPFIY